MIVRGICAMVLCVFMIPAVVTPTWAQESTSPEPPAGAMTDIIDIKPLQEIVFSLPLIRIISLAGILAALVLLLFFLMRRRRKKMQFTKPERLPHEIALSELDALAAETSITPREFHFRLSAILRGYIERRFTIPALEMTTEEFLPSLEKLAIDRGMTVEIKSLAGRADPIKFAGLGADRNSMKNDLALVSRLVDQTRPDLLAPKEPGDGNV
jgi:hypothetical protein